MAVLPQASVAINVLVTVYSLAQVPGSCCISVVMETAPQASVAVGVPNDGVSGHSMVAAAGTEVNTGARIISHSDHLRCSRGITASIGCNKCSCNSIFISTGARSCCIVVVMETAPQASVAVGVPNDGVSGHSMVVLQARK